MRTRQAPRNFKSGELAPWLDGIANELTGQGCRTLENFVVKKQGAATQRPGTFYAGEVKDSNDVTILVPVTIDDDNRYVLEIGDAYIRFWDQATHAVLGAPYEVTSPWSAGDLSDLRYVPVTEQNALYFSHPQYPTYHLTYNSGTSWVLGVLPILAGGPMVVSDYYYNLKYTNDLINWKDLKTVEYAGGSGKEVKLIVNNGEYFIFGQSIIKKSEDLTSWVDIKPGIIQNIYDVTKTGIDILWAAGNSTSATIIYSFDNGISWTSVSIPSGNIRIDNIDYDPNTQNLKAIGYGTCTLWANEGNTWASVTMSVTDCKAPYDMEFGGDLWVCSGESNSGSGTIWTSHSAADTWNVAYAGGTLRPYKLLYGDYDGSTFWIGSCAGGKILRSGTGSIWATTTVLAEVAQGGYVAKDSLYLFGSRYYWSTRDGISFTTHTLIDSSLPANNSIMSASYDTDTKIEWFDKTEHYPSKIGWNEGRLVLAAPICAKNAIYGSNSNKPQMFYLGDIANYAYEYDITSESNVDIQWIMGGLGGLVVGTRTAEGILLGSPDEGITPSAARFQWLSTFGSSNIQPVRVHDTIIFIQRGGEIVRGYQPVQGAWKSQDLTEFADHIAKGGITQLARQDDPQSIVHAIRNDGQRLDLTYDIGIRAWSRTKLAPTAGSVAIIESIAVIPTSGAEDEIWCVVRRDIGGASKRYIEYFDTLAPDDKEAAHYVDCGVYKTSGTTFAIVGSLTHIAGENVDALINGTRVVSGLTVAASGTITVAPYSGTEIHVGLPYTSYLQTMKADYGSPWGAGAGLEKKTSSIYAWVHDSLAIANFGPTTTTATEDIVYSSSTTLNTEVIRVNYPGQWDRDGYIWCIVRDPRPFTLVAMLADSETGDQ